MAEDPIKQTATRIVGQPHDILERRLKTDAYAAITRVKPTVGDNVSFEDDVMSGTFFETLTPALQGIAVVRMQNAISFYDRVGWRDAYLEKPIESVLTEFQVEKITEKIKLTSLHDLAYISHKHIEKMLGKIESAKLWETLKSFKLDS